MSDGVRNGISICLNLVIPSMFIFMIFSDIIIKTKLSFFISFPFKWLSKFIRLNAKEHTIFILSLIGGYPIGAKLLYDAVNENNISKNNISADKASKMLAFCVNCSPAFLITGIGEKIFFNSLVGIYIYIAQIISALLIAFIMGVFYKEKPDNALIKPCDNKELPLSALLVNSVNDSVKTMVLICGFVVAFSGIMPIINFLLPKFLNKTIISGLLEMTIGCNSLIPLLYDNYYNAILLAAFFVSFGGICVHMQLTCLIKRGYSKPNPQNNILNNISMKYYFASRPIFILFTCFFTWLILHFFPLTIPYDKIENIISTLSPLKTAFESKIYSVTPLSTFFLLLLSIMLLFFTRKSDKI